MTQSSQALKQQMDKKLQDVLPENWKYNLVVEHHNTIVLTITKLPVNPYLKVALGVDIDHRIEQVIGNIDVRTILEQAKSTMNNCIFNDEWYIAIRMGK